MNKPNFKDKQPGHNIRDIRLKKGMTLEDFVMSLKTQSHHPALFPSGNVVYLLLILKGSNA